MYMYFEPSISVFSSQWLYKAHLDAPVPSHVVYTSVFGRKESPKQVVRDFLPPQEDGEALNGWPAGGLRVVHQEVEMLSAQILGVTCDAFSVRF